MKKVPGTCAHIRSRRQKWWARGLALTLVFALVAPLGGQVAAAREEESGGICAHHLEHTAECGYEPASAGAPCTHVHDAFCGYIAPEDSVEESAGLSGFVKPAATEEPEGFSLGTESTQPPVQTSGTCNHVHDDVCGYAEAAQGHPCNFVCPWCVTGWEWDDEEGLLVWDGDVKLWGLGVPGTDAVNPLTREALEELLPQAVTVRTAAGEDTVSLMWDLGAFPVEGAYQGTYTLTASLEGEYVLTEETPALSVLLELGGGGMYADTRGCWKDRPVAQVLPGQVAGGDGTTHKFVNNWSYVLPAGGTEITDNGETKAEGEQLIYSTTVALQFIAIIKNSSSS